MSQPLRTERPDVIWFITTRTVRSELWFINNPKLQERMAAYLAKYQEKYGVILYDSIFMGNHPHLLAQFPKKNMAAFMRDWKSVTAKLVKRYQSEYLGGPLYARRYDALALIDEVSVEDKFLYTALNAVSSGIVERVGEYPNYQGTFDALRGIDRKFKIVDWRAYRDKKRFNKTLKPKDFEKTYTLRYSRLPGYEHLSQQDYEREFREKIEARRSSIILERRNKGQGFLGVELLKKQRPGQRPKTTKTSTENSYRPLVQCSCPLLRQEYLSSYFSLVRAYRECVELSKRGIKDVFFPTGTYPPPLLILN